MLFLGIDGGGTTTRAAIVQGDGRLVGSGKSSGSNYQSVGLERARMAIDEAVGDAFEQGKLTREVCEAVFLGMAGVATAIDRAAIIDIVAGLGLAIRIDVDHDIRIALAGGLTGREGIALIAGTGSSCYGRRVDGTDHRAGGWGALLDDVGGGYWIGIEGLRAAVRAHDGRGTATALQLALPHALGAAEMDDLLRLTGVGGSDRETIASLAPLVLHHAFDGDSVAFMIAERGAVELSAMIRAVSERLWNNAPSPPVIGTGGLLADRRYRRMITPRLLQPHLPPVLGAAILAMEGAGLAVDDHVIQAMIDSITRSAV